MALQFTIDLQELAMEGIEAFAEVHEKNQLVERLQNEMEYLARRNAELEAASGPKYCQECGRFADVVCCQNGHTLSS